MKPSPQKTKAIQSIFRQVVKSQRDQRYMTLYELAETPNIQDMPTNYPRVIKDILNPQYSF